MFFSSESLHPRLHYNLVLLSDLSLVCLSLHTRESTTILGFYLFPKYRSTFEEAFCKRVPCTKFLCLKRVLVLAPFSYAAINPFQQWSVGVLFINSVEFTPIPYKIGGYFIL